MRKGIHPDYQEVVFMDSATGAKFVAGSTLKPEETIEFEGKTYPLVRVEISSPILYWQAKVCTSRWSYRKIQQEVRYFFKELIILGIFYQKSSPLWTALFS